MTVQRSPGYKKLVLGSTLERISCSRRNVLPERAVVVVDVTVSKPTEDSRSFRCRSNLRRVGIEWDAATLMDG